MSQMGQKRKSSNRANDVRFPPNSDPNSGRSFLSASCQARTHAAQQKASSPDGMSLSAAQVTRLAATAQIQEFAVLIRRNQHVRNADADFAVIADCTGMKRQERILHNIPWISLVGRLR